MSFQAFQTSFPQTAFIDLKTGLLTKEGRLLLTALWQRSGSGSGIIPIVSPPLTATGTTQATALALVADWNDVETVPTGSGVVFPTMKPGNDITVFNGSGNALNVYPFSGGQIDGLAVNAAFPLPAGKLRCWECWGTAQMRFAYGTP